MHKSGPTPPIKHGALFTYGNKQIPFQFWSTGPSDTIPDTLIFLGTGQVGKISRWVAESVPAGVVVVEGLPHWHSHRSARNLLEFSHAYTEAAYRAVVDTFHSKSLHIIGESQSTPSTIWLAKHTGHSTGNVALVLPMGLNTASFGINDKARYLELRKRAAQTFMQPEQSPLRDIRSLYVAALLAMVIMRGTLNGSTRNMYTAGISLNLLEDFQTLLAHQHREKKTITLFLGGKDKIFREHEIRQALADADIPDVAIVATPQLTHASLALRSSAQLVNRAITSVRQKA